MRIVTATVILLLIAAATRPAAAAQCSAQTLMVEATPVTVSYCLNGPTHSTGTQEIAVPVVSTYSTHSRTVSHPGELHFLAGEGVSRVIESLDLTQLGLTGTLHLTLAYVGGLVQVEGALLTPGAITIK